MVQITGNYLAFFIALLSETSGPGTEPEKLG